MNDMRVDTEILHLSAEIAAHETLLVAMVRTYPQLKELIRRYDEESYARVKSLRDACAPDPLVQDLQIALESTRGILLAILDDEQRSG